MQLSKRKEPADDSGEHVDFQRDNKILFCPRQRKSMRERNSLTSSAQINK